MQSMKILTLAIPAYNMEKFLGRCLDSVLHHDYDSKVEVIVINDGSKDSTIEIARDYAARFPKQLRVIDKSNGGWGSAVNIAMKEATGRYFRLLDSDDWFDPKAYRNFLELLETTDADIVATSYTKVYDSVPNRFFGFESELCGHKMSMSQRLEQTGYLSDAPMATLCYRRELLEGFAVADRFYADVEFAMIPFAKASTILYSDLNLYQYYLGREDHSTSVSGYRKNFRDYIKMTCKLVRIYDTLANSVPVSGRKLMQNEIIKHVIFSYYLLLSPTFFGCDPDSKDYCIRYDGWLREASAYFYKRASSARVKKIIPYISIWRAIRVNVLKLRPKWI